MVFVKHNSLNSYIFFNPIFIPGFSLSRFFRVQVFQGTGFSGSRVQGPGPGFRSSYYFLVVHASSIVTKHFSQETIEYL